MLVDVPLEAVSKLAERDDVLYVEPRFAGEEPPQNTNANDDVDDGRARIVSDPYFNLGQTGGWIGLLDTSLRFTHTQCNAPSHIDFRRDRVNGGADCNTGTGLNPNDDCWNHGTSSAAIITANANQGNPCRGVTGVTLDSFKVYPSTTTPQGACNGYTRKRHSRRRLPGVALAWERETVLRSCSSALGPPDRADRGDRA